MDAANAKSLLPALCIPSPLYTAVSVWDSWDPAGGVYVTAHALDVLLMGLRVHEVMLNAAQPAVPKNDTEPVGAAKALAAVSVTITVQVAAVPVGSGFGAQARPREMVCRVTDRVADPLLFEWPESPG